MRFILKPYYIYPILFAIFSPLALLSSNLNETSPEVVWRPLLVCLIFGALVFLFLWLSTRNIENALLVTSIFLILFFSYGHIYDALDGVQIVGIAIGKNRYLLSLFIGISLSLFLFGRKWKKPPAWLHTSLLIIGLALVILPVFNISSFLINESLTRGAEKRSNPSVLEPATLSTGVLTPDVYYIILDSYTRQDALLSDIKYDNSGFIEDLTKLGFTVADCARSNYSSTIFSVPAAFNMDYLDNLNPKLLDPSGKKAMLTDLFRNPKIRNEFAKYGYQWVAIDPGRKGLEMENADLFIQPDDISKYLEFKEMINDFEDMFLRTTPGIVIANFGDRLFGGSYEKLRFPYYKRAAYQLFILDTLPKIPEIAGPKFVYAHIMLPHYPYIFTADGQLRTDPEYLYEPIPYEKSLDGYRGQTTFINSKILPVIKSIIERSAVPPIIIIQGDHGKGGKNRLKILEAYYLPESIKSEIYPTITPVNSFRVILNGLFDRGLPLLEDKSYLASNHYTFTEIKEDNPVCISNTGNVSQ